VSNTFPGEVLLQVAADALEWCGASRTDPLALEAVGERFLPECAFRGRQNRKLQFAVLAVAALRGGAEPDLLDEVAWWQTDGCALVRSGVSHMTGQARLPGGGAPGRAVASGSTAPAAGWHGAGCATVH
jgi:hypothetical protein